MDSLNNLQEQDIELKIFLVDVAPKNISQEILQDRMSELENLVNTF
jgi:hypothetical protein